MPMRGKFILVGISHKTAHVDVRERFSVSKSSLPNTLLDIKNIDGVAECVLLSTCNRTELYVFAETAPEDVAERLKMFFLEMSGLGEDQLEHFYVKIGMDVMNHLFQVSCGLDSLIFGEPQIFGQIKEAFTYASDAGCTDSMFNRLFHYAFQVGKDIRNRTGVQKGIVSLSSAAVLLGEKVHGKLNGKKALLIGTGKVGKTCARQLINAGIEHIYITNRTPEHAHDIVDELSGELIPYETMRDMLDKVDVVVTSVSSPEPILTKEQLFIARKGHDEAIVIIDLGVPRNVDADAACIDGVHLFNIDDMENVTQENQKNRLKDRQKAEYIIDEKVQEYTSWLDVRDVAPIINVLYEKCENIRKSELERISNKVDDETFETINILSRRIVRKILHHPTMKMRTSETGKNRDRLLDSINELFITETQN